MKTIIICGAGRGLGNHIAKRFGKEGYRVVLFARNIDSLKKYQYELQSSGIETYIHQADAASPESLSEAISWSRSQFGTPDVFYYNVGNTCADKPGQMDYRQLMEHFQMDVASAYHCVKEITDKDFSSKKGAVIFTGGGLGEYPISMFTPLSIDKAALKALAFLLHDELQPKGIYVGILTVCGSIGNDSYMSPERMADAVWTMNENRDKCEEKYEYKELMNRTLSTKEYWSEVYALAQKYR